jgi:predicted regulator of Ras-like GTPase activity (Roadblock/LC7/MglB family)
MSAKKRIAALSGLDGVREVSLIGRDGDVLESSADAATLADAAPRLGQALQALQMALPGLGAPMSLTLEAENGALHVAQAGESLLLLTTTREANLGAVRLELREAVQELNAPSAG